MAILKYQLIHVLFFTSIFSVGAQSTKKVLFLGNSFTAVNNLPSMVSSMASSTGDSLVYDSNTPGGHRLMDHSSNTTSLNKIASNTWDYIVLQGQSQETSWAQWKMQIEVYPYANSLCNAIRLNNECSEPMFYMTWGRENGDAAYCDDFPWVCTYNGMDSAIRETYVYMADTNNAKIAPVGAVWRYLRTNHPEIDLYANDGSHPSIAGTYAAACAFYTLIYEKDPTQITWCSSLPKTDANVIKLAAKNVALDSLSNWDLTIKHVKADFIAHVNSNQVSFTNMSNNYDSLIWNFGDGTSSTETNPNHTYFNSGTYNVSLIVWRCGVTDTLVKPIDIIIQHIDMQRQKTIKISPNPIVEKLNIQFNKRCNSGSIFICDIMGEATVERQFMNAASLNIDVSALPKGVFLMHLRTDGEVYVSRLIKAN